MFKSLILTLMSFAHPCHATPRQDTFKKLAPSTVKVNVYKGTDIMGTGSGTVIASAKGVSMVLTCAHVVSHDKVNVSGITIEIELSNGLIAVYPAYIDKIDPSLDLAVLVVRKLEAPAAPIAFTDPERYSVVYNVSAPLGVIGTPSEGLVADVKGTYHGLPLYQISGTTIQGSSGSAEFNEEGQIVCVVEMNAAGHSNQVFPQIGFCIPQSTIRAFTGSYDLNAK